MIDVLRDRVKETPFYRVWRSARLRLRGWSRVPRWRWKQRQQLRAWRRGEPVSTPGIEKHRVVREYGERFSTPILVETGSYRGDLIHAMRKRFREIYSIELSEELHRGVKARFARYPQIRLFHGDSGTVLPEVLGSIGEPCLFWLDAHFGGGVTAKAELDTPVRAEIEHILAHPVQGHVILIDDASCFSGTNGYPTLDELRATVAERRPDWAFEVRDDIVRIHPRQPLPPSPRTGGGKLLVRFGLITAAALCSLLVCEVCLRLVAPRSSAFYVPDPQVGVIHEPGGRGWWRSGEYSVRVHFNQSGFRDRDFAVPKPRGIFRIVVVGDSYVEALQVPLEQTFHKMFEADLRTAGYNVEVAALGVGGMGTAQELRMLRAYAKPLRPDLVILLFNPGNDVKDNHPRLKKDPRFPYCALDGTRLVERPFWPHSRRRAKLSNWLRNLSNLYALVRDASYHPFFHGRAPREIPSDFLVYKRNPGPVWEESWRLTEALLSRFAEETREMRARLLVVIVPNRIELPGKWTKARKKWRELRNPEFSPEVPLERVRSILRGARMDALDLVPIFTARVNQTHTQPHFRIDGHWNPVGHRWAADEIRKDIERRRWLPISYSGRRGAQ